ncbi:MAG: hypothetical protein A2388_02180 [Candidatus Veblenbacteria bacterium RIFOXYB1_FULL_43_13]|uniref:DUF5667 domain-containing protein n=2 Tax=Candidatus Vebleniibacteriota TaxID=1817921 RepID=A0A1G2Q5J5_9BACT|nr:MAG: hypothetical protein A2388_02180 [Candidatus Veblenbacteria bacterium RIFOXYB1_FULL_43_13]OHA55844.1 MAG: hypothetical protein A2226_03970 [Candidatus Veblenbacteria bacterium RIFOXYA2_FULL_43_9]
MYIVLSLILTLSLATGGVVAANGSVPGEKLYGVKKLKEKIELQLALSPEARAEAYAKHSQARLAEYAELRSRLNTAMSTDNEQTNSEKETVLTQLTLESKQEADLSVSTSLAAMAEIAAELRQDGETETAAEVEQAMMVLNQTSFQTSASAETNNDYYESSLELDVQSESSAQGSVNL